MKPFNPDHELAAARAGIELLASTPGFRDYAIDKARRMAREEHGLWAPLAEVAEALQPTTPRASRASNPRRSA